MEFEDPFKVLGLAPRFSLSMAELEKCVLCLQKEVHPDRMGKEKEQLSTKINAAWGILRDPMKRAQVLLQHAGMWPIPEEEDFSAPFFALWEELAELPEDAQKDKLQSLRAKFETILQELGAAFEAKNFQTAKILFLEAKILTKIIEAFR